MFKSVQLLFCLTLSLSSYAQSKNWFDIYPNPSEINWVVQQQLILNYQPTKTLKVIMGGIDGNYVKIAYNRLNDSIFSDSLEATNLTISPISNTYKIKENKLIECFLHDNKYVEFNKNGYTDSLGFLVKEIETTKSGSSVKERIVLEFNTQNKLVNSWIYLKDSDTIIYKKYTELLNNCEERIIYSISGLDTMQISTTRDCYGNGADFLVDKNVFLWSWKMQQKKQFAANYWIIPTERKHRFDLIDMDDEPTLINGKLIDNDDDVEFRTNKKGIVEKIYINSVYDPRGYRIIFIWE